MLKELEEAYHFIFEEELIREISECGTLKTIQEGKMIMNIFTRREWSSRDC